MYLSHFGLKEKPFKISTDPRFLWLGEKHKEALATLLYGILYNDGYVVVTGDVGTGKTTLASALMNELGDRVIAVKIPFPDFESLDFLKLISTGYGIDNSFQSKGSFFPLFTSFLRSSSSAGKKVILIIDEAQRLTSDHLQELLQLSNIEENGSRLLNIVFVGQNEFNDILLEESNRALRQRVTINYNLGTLTREETNQYIAHRLKVAQGERGIFPPEAIEEVFLFSAGVPRLINIVCDLALLMTFFEKGKIVRPENVKECIQRLRLPKEKAAGEGNGSHPASGMEESVNIEIDEKERDEDRAKRVGESGRRRWGGKTVYGVVFIFLILLVGSIFFFSKQEVSREAATSKEPREEADQKDKVPQKGMESANEKDSANIAPAAVNEPVPSGETGRGSDSSFRDPESSLPEETKKVMDGGVQGANQKKQETISLKKSVGSIKPAAPGSLREKGRAPEKTKVLADQRKAASEDTREKMGRNPGLTPGPPGQEPSSRSAEEIDSDKVIEWLIERRSDKK
jgi:type II secretory pathway predicted ATPase ExeA/Na+-transporting methylmalonyl-CoA/oxaloacetate decarboxylase gamma subunit